MSTCEALTAGASAGVAPALRAVDCLANETTSVAFARLFGSDGALLPALTILLTLYIAFFAFSLLTGRSRIGISALSPRMMTMGLVLTFATSWVAYQSVVWNLAIGGPDQIAGVLMGAQGSATQLFADRIDIVFAAIAEVGSQTNAGAQPGAVPTASGSFTPGNLMWLAALLLMLGTVGVLVTARIALAVLLALGPIFVVFALFPGTRGLFAGWLRGVVLTAIAPLFAVLGGGFMLELAVPVVSALRNAEGVVDGRASMALFMIAAVHVALMVMVMRVCGTMVSSWQVFGLASDTARDTGATSVVNTVQAAGTVAASSPAAASAAAIGRASVIAPAALVQSNDTPGAALGPLGSRSRSTIINANSNTPALPPLIQQRARGVGSRFRPSSHSPRGMIR
jgi:type IV secretion system protein VirB6